MTMDAGTVRFDRFELDLASGDLKKDGQAVKLPRQPSELLTLLVRNAGALVTRESIQKALWPDGTVVDYDQSINFSIKRIREALGDDPSRPRYVATVPRKGYRFVSEIELERPDAVPTSLKRVHPILVLSLGALVAAVVAILIGFILRPTPDSDVTRFIVPLDGPGPGVPFDLSPDGRRLVYVSNRERFEGNLHVRPIDSFESTPIPGAVGAAPFFSPNGKWVAYRRREARDLLKVRLDGGPPILVSDAGLFGHRGAAWADENTIVIVGGDLGPLYRLSAAGGEPEQITRIESENGDLAHVWPYALPGGEWVLFTNFQRLGYDNPIDAVSLRTGERRTVRRSGTSPRYAPSGHLLFVHTETLFAIELDPVSLETRGEPVAVLDGVASSSATGGAMYRVAGDGTLAYVPAPPRSLQRLEWFDRDGTREALELPALSARFEPGLPILGPRLSPDGRRLAVSMPERPDGPAVVRLYDLERKTETRLSDEPAAAWVEWSPDGERLVYHASGRGGFELIVRSPDRIGDAWTAYRSSGIFWPLSWLPSGDAILLRETHRETTGVDVMRIDLDHDDPAPYPVLDSTEHEGNAKLSPDGTLLAFTVDGRLYLCTYPGLEDRMPVSTEPGVQPRWSPDGSELFFVGRGSPRRLMAVDVTTHPELAVSEPRELFSGELVSVPGGATNYDVTPDGKRFLMVVEETLPEASPQIHIVLDWVDELEAKMAQAER